MGQGSTYAAGLVGIEGKVIEVQARISSGLSTFALVGLPDTALREARERVRAAVGACSLPWSDQRVTVNLMPADVPKAGTGFDLAIAVALLCAANKIPDRNTPMKRLHIGELSLDGRVRAVRGILPAVAAAAKMGIGEVVVPAACVSEASLVPGVEVYGVGHLTELVNSYGGNLKVPDITALPAPCGNEEETTHQIDLSEVRGQDFARQALEVAAAGGHHIFFMGVPGSGKTMLAQRLPTILPDLDDEAAIAATSVHSVAGLFQAESGLLRRPPFIAPHHSATLPAMVGGGSGMPRPGAVSLAHGGVLFLDETPEFSPRVLDALRQPLESGKVAVHRALAQATLPAKLQLVAAANPCPCGMNVGMGDQCRCSSIHKRRYLQRMSGPLLDRIDIQVKIDRPTRAALAIGTRAESSAVVAKRVIKARKRAADRLRDTPWKLNNEVPGSYLRSSHSATPKAQLADLDRAIERGIISLRGADRITRLAWTLADLDAENTPAPEHFGTAIGMRTGEIFHV